MTHHFRPAAALLTLLVVQSLWALTLAPAQAVVPVSPVAVTAQG
jgi:hypothetical protein